MSNGKGFGGLVKQAQRMQQQISRVQDEMGDKEVEATAGGGVVRAVVNGQQELVDLEISPEVFSSGDAEMLEELVMTAVNLAMENAQSMIKKEVDRITGGLSIPGLF